MRLILQNTVYYVSGYFKRHVGRIQVDLSHLDVIRSRPLLLSSRVQVVRILETSRLLSLNNLPEVVILWSINSPMHKLP